MHRQSGFSVLTLLLLAATLLASLTFVFIGGGPNVQGQLNAQKAAQLVAQAQLIVHRITKCATDYPAGENGTDFHKPYPKDANPVTPNTPTALAVSLLTCPGNSNPSPNLWSGVDGVFAPTPIAGFGAWTYTNASTAAISIKATTPGTYSTSLSAAAAQLGTAANLTIADTLTVEVIK